MQRRPSSNSQQKSVKKQHKVATQKQHRRSFTKNTSRARSQAVASSLPQGISTQKINAKRTGRRHFSSTGKPQLTAVLGMQWGDEGKGKLIDVLAEEYDVVARFNGGANAGHTLVVNGKKFPCHLLPCGLFYPGVKNVIGNGVVLDIPQLFKELDNATSAGLNPDNRLFISDRAHIVFDFHKAIDGHLETNAKKGAIGTTKRGIGPAYTNKMKRDGIRVGELLDWEHFKARHTKLAQDTLAMYGITDYDITEEQERLKQYRDALVPMIADTVTMLNLEHQAGKRILAEGANAALLDVDFGTYPYVTSSSTTSGGISTGLGLAPNKIDHIYGVVKAYTTRVGGGPFPTEQLNEIGTQLAIDGHEFGTTTGRQRRCGWLDIPVIKYANFLNGATHINITKLDVLSKFDRLQIGTHYEIDGKRLPQGSMPSSLDQLAKVKPVYEEHPGWNCDISEAKTFAELPVEAQQYLTRVQELIGTPISHVGVGPERSQMIQL